jgi:hypothetical protein
VPLDGGVCDISLAVLRFEDPLMVDRTPISPDYKASAMASQTRIETSRKLLDYASGNPVKTLSSVVSILGGLLLLMFLTDIEFLPDVDLAGIVSMLYAVALLGLTLVAVMAALLVFPALLLRGVREMFGKRSHAAASKIAHTGYPAEPMSAEVRPTPFAEIFPWTFAFATWAVVLVWQLTAADQTWMRWLAGVGAVACFLGALVQVCRETFALRRVSAARRKELSAWWWVPLESATALLALTMPAFVILRLTSIGDWAHESISPLILVTLVLLLMASAVVACVLSLPHPQIGFGVGIAFALALFALVATQTHSVTAVPHTIVRKLRLGDIELARIGVTAAGCRQINAALGATVCPVAPDADAVTPLCPVRIRSRVGQQLVLEFGAITWNRPSSESHQKQWLASWLEPKQRMRRVILDKAQMPSWQPLHAGVDEEDVVLEDTAPAHNDVTLWRSSRANGDVHLQRLCDVRLESATEPTSSAASAAVSALAPASAPLPPKAARD